MYFVSTGTRHCYPANLRLKARQNRSKFLVKNLLLFETGKAEQGWSSPAVRIVARIFFWAATNPVVFAVPTTAGNSMSKATV